MELLIDTATPSVRVGLGDGAAVVAAREWTADRALSATLAAEIRTLLASSGRRLSDIETIRVHAGPGGFTTLRIGVVTANALGYALGVPVCGVRGEIATLEGLQRAPSVDPATPVIPVYDRPQVEGSENAV